MVATQVERIGQEIEEPLRVLGLDLEAVELTPAGKRRVLRVAVDQDGGVTMDDVAEATAAISAVLDSSDVMGQLPYTLEVTSRGVDRPLTEPRHWRRNVDRLVKVTLEDDSALTGRILESGPDSAVVDVSGRRHDVSYAEVRKALVQVEFNRKPAPPTDAPADAPADTDHASEEDH